MRRLLALWLAVGCGGDGFRTDQPAEGEGEGEGEGDEGEGDEGEAESEGGPGVATTDVPLSPDESNSSGLTTDEDGDLVIDADGTFVVLPFIWIANSDEGTVSKIDTESAVEVARYRTGPGSPDPSRTTVGLSGDVVVANRGGSSAARIHADTATCPDANGDGVIATSTGPADLLAWGSDECVLWLHDFGPEGGGLARAAAFDFVAGPDGALSSSVWIGLWDAQKVVRLDAETGATIAEVSIAGHCPYGLAFDGSGDLWVSDRCANQLVHVDVETLAWEAIAIPSGCDPYGIAADGDGYVWLPTYSCGTLYRYEAATATWASVGLGGGGGRGVAHDGAGSVWVAVNGGSTNGVHRIDAATMGVLGTIPFSGTLVGMAVDFGGLIWSVNQSTSEAHRIDPDTLETLTVSTGSGPYTYSDMTGFQLVNAAPPLGIYAARVEGCGPETEWFDLAWSATTPTGTFVRFRARTANTLEDLLAREFVSVAEQPDDASPVDLGAALEAAAPGWSFGHYLEIEMTLGSDTPGATPELGDVEVTSNGAAGCSLE